MRNGECRRREKVRSTFATFFGRCCPQPTSRICSRCRCRLQRVMHTVPRLTRAELPTRESHFRFRRFCGSQFPINNASVPARSDIRSLVQISSTCDAEKLDTVRSRPRNRPFVIRVATFAFSSFQPPSRAIRKVILVSKSVRQTLSR